VFADCDFDNAVATVTRSCFENAGQVCLGTERVYVERPIFDKFVAALKERPKMKPGRPFDPDTKIGPLVSKIHQKKVLGMYAKAKEEGANIVFGGGIPDMPEELKDGCWVQPTIWTGLPETAVVPRKSSGRAATSSPSTPKRKSWRWPTTTATASPPRSTPRTSAAPCAGQRDRSRPVLDQQLVPARPAHPVRRLQAVRHRP
jgi:hypothetical protein